MSKKRNGATLRSNIEDLEAVKRTQKPTSLQVNQSGGDVFVIEASSARASKKEREKKTKKKTKKKGINKPTGCKPVQSHLIDV